MMTYEEARIHWQRHFLMKALQEANGIQTRAAKSIQVHRNMFQRMLREAGITSRQMKAIVRHK
jgi:DNA-binding NtrC family response regulator